MILLERTKLSLIPLFALAVCGCQQAQSQSQPSPPKALEVQVSLPVHREITDYEDFTGRTEAVHTIEIRARATGFLEKLDFKEGADVEKGATLFEIDARPYLAELARAEAAVAQSEAHLKRLQLDAQRAQNLRPKGAISPEEYDKVVGDRAEAEASLKVAKSNLQIAELHLKFTKVTAPISGRLGRSLIDPGNMVKADETALTTIVSLDPIYAYFDVDERTVLRIRRLVQEGKIKSAREATVPIQLGLADEVGFPHEGTVNFIDNHVEASTGTLRIRGIFPNPKAFLTPGMFVRVRVPIGTAYNAMLVAEQAIGTDQGQKFLYVVDSSDQVVYRPVKTGRLHQGLRVITDGLEANDRVVVSGLQRVRQGAKVSPKAVEMPVRSGRASPAK